MIEIIKEWTEEEFFNEYWTSSKTINPLTKVETQEQWLDLGKVHEKNKDADYIICIGENTLGKSFSVEQLFVRNILLNKKQIWIRNRKSEASLCVDAWNSILARNNLLKEYGADAKGVYKKPELIENVDKEGQPILDKYGNKKYKQKYPDEEKKYVIPFVYMSSPDSSTPPIEGLSVMCWDEVLGGNEKNKFTMMHPLAALRKLEKRTRALFNDNDGNVFTFILANPHIPEADIFSELQCDWDWAKSYNRENIFFKYKTENGLVVIFSLIQNLDNVKNDYLKKQLERDRKVGITGYEYPEPCMKRCIPRPNDAYPYKNFTFNFISYTAYTYDNGERIWISLKNKDANHLPNFAIDQEDQHQGNIYLVRQEDIYHEFIDLLEMRLNNKVLYSQPFVAEDLTHFFTFLELVRKNEENEH